MCMFNYCLDVGIPLIAIGAMAQPLGAFIATLLADENALGTGHWLTSFYLGLDQYILYEGVQRFGKTGQPRASAPGTVEADVPTYPYSRCGRKKSCTGLLLLQEQVSQE